MNYCCIIRACRHVFIIKYQRILLSVQGQASFPELIFIIPSTESCSSGIIHSCLTIVIVSGEAFQSKGILTKKSIFTQIISG